MSESKILAIATALISCSGLADLTKLEMRLWWRLISIIQEGRGITVSNDGVMLKVLAKELKEDGEVGRREFTDRLRSLSHITIEGNLDGRDNNEVWRIGLKLVSEYEVKSSDDYVYINIGSRFYNAIMHRETYTRIREDALFAMKGCKYSSILYQLIRDKFNMREKRWIVNYDTLRMYLQIKEGTYETFGNFRQHCLEKAVAEINEISELDLSWEKHQTSRNRVIALSFTWKLKEFSEAKKVARSLQYSAVGRGVRADTIIEVDDDVRIAIKALETADYWTRKTWADIYVKSGFGFLDSSMVAAENIRKWVDRRIAEKMREEGFI